MKDYGVSCNQSFEQEKKQLKGPPPSPFELSEWRQAKVHPDCHIQVEKNFYSVLPVSMSAKGSGAGSPRKWWKCLVKTASPLPFTRD